MKQKPKQKVEVDKDFLASVLKTQTEMKESIRILKEAKNPIPQPAQTISQGIFWCVAVDTFGASNRDEFQKSFKNFEKQLEVLMRQYKLVSVNASLFSQI